MLCCVVILTVLALFQSCTFSSSMMTTTKYAGVCSSNDLHTRTQEIAELCRKAGMPDIEISQSTTLHRVIAKIPLPSERYFNVQHNKNLVWAVYVRSDSIIAFAFEQDIRNDLESVNHYFDNTTATTERWYWEVRNGLGNFCGTALSENFYEGRNITVADMPYRIESDAIMSQRPVLTRILENRVPDTTQSIVELTNNYQLRTAFLATQSSSLWELDNTILNALRLTEKKSSFDRVRLFKADNDRDSFILDTREFGLDSSTKRYVLSSAELDELRYVLKWKLPNTVPEIPSEQRLSQYDLWWEGEKLADIYSINTLFSPLLPEAQTQNFFPTSFSSLRIAAPLLVMGGNLALSLYALSQPFYTRSTSDLIIDGATWAIPQGMALYSIFEDETNPNFFAMHAVGSALALARTCITLRLPDMLGFNHAQMRTLLGGGSSGTIIGLLLPLVLGIQPAQAQANSFFSFVPTAPASLPLRAMGISAVLGTGLGYYAGYQIAIQQERPMTGGNGAVFDGLGKAGFGLPFALGLSIPVPGVEHFPIVSAIAIATQIGGFALSSAILSHHDFSYEQEVSLRSSEAIGAGLGALAALIVPRTAGGLLGLQSFVTLPLLGWSTGFLIGLLNQIPDARARFIENSALKKVSGKIGIHEHGHSWFDDIASRTNIEFSPLGLASLFAPATSPLGFVSAPIINIHHRFK